MISRRDPRQHRRLAASGLPPFTPQSLPNLFAWWRADKGMTLDGSNNVSQWNDSSGSGDSNRNLTQATTTKRPAFNASNASYGNQATVTFTGANNDVLNTGTLSATLTQPCTVYLVGHCLNATGDGFLTGNSGIVIEDLGGGGTGVRLTETSAITATPTTLNTASITYCIADGASSAIGVRQNTANVTGNVGAGSDTALSIGALNSLGTSAPFSGPMAEIIFYEAHHTAAQIAQVTAYLALRYGLSQGA